MPGRIDIHDFGGGANVTESQQERLGERGPDPFNNGEWIYGQFFENVAFHPGMVARHAGPSDTADGTITTGSPIGSTRLIDSGEFANDNFVGALGLMYDGTGEGQGFYVQKMVNDDEVKIVLRHGVTTIPKGPDTRGWEIALDTTSKYRLWLPGRFYQGDGTATEIKAGICYATVTPTATYKPHGYVKREGSCIYRKAAASTMTEGGLLLATGNGLVAGAGTLTLANITRIVGRSNVAVAAYSGVGLIDGFVDIPYIGPSYLKSPKAGHPLAPYDIK